MYKYIIAILLLSHISKAEIVIWPLGFATRLERNENQNLITQSSFQYAGGVHFYDWSAELSRIEFNSKTHEGNISVEREYQDMILWLGHHFLVLNKIEFIGSGGVGLYQEKIVTLVGSSSNVSTSEQKVLFGLSGELRMKPYDIGLLLSSGIRIIIAENFDPNPQPEIFVRTGWQF